MERGWLETRKQPPGENNCQQSIPTLPSSLAQLPPIQEPEARLQSSLRFNYGIGPRF
jgi:hypothetical protein